MNRAVFLDRDGTINVERHYLHRIEEFEFISGAVRGLKKLQGAGYLLIIITNQSGIARGYYAEEDLWRLNDWMKAVLQAKGIRINGVYYCPHHPSATDGKYGVICNCRKPSLGLYEQAIRDFEIDVENSWSIGDKIRDCAICENTRCRGFLVGNNEKQEILEMVMQNQYKNIQYAADLEAAADMILEVAK